MTLKDKFNNLVPSEFGGMQEPLLTNCVKIAEDLAIGFLDWYGEQPLHVVDGKSTKTLLKMYKNQKGL